MKYLSTIALLSLLFFACKKSNSVTPIPKPQPTIAWTISPTDAQRGDTAWYGDSKTVSFSTTNATSVVISGVSTTGVSGSFQTPSITSAITYTATVTGDGGIITSTISIPVYSQRRTFLCKDITWIMDSSTFWMIDSQEQPISSVNQGVMDPNRYTYFPNNTAEAWVQLTNSTHPFTWSLQNNETKMETTGDIWNIEFLSAMKLVKTQIKPDPFNPQYVFKNRVVYKKKI